MSKKDVKASGKKAKAKKDDGAAKGAPTVAGHPRARGQIRRAKGWGGLAGFGIAAYLSMKAGVPAPDAGMRALIAGIAGYMIAWACAVTVWRHLLVAELRTSLELSRKRAAAETIRVKPAPPERPEPAEEPREE